MLREVVGDKPMIKGLVQLTLQRSRRNCAAQALQDHCGLNSDTRHSGLRTAKEILNRRLKERLGYAV